MTPRDSRSDAARSGVTSRRNFLQASAAAIVATQVTPALAAGEPAASSTSSTIAGYVIARLRAHGARALFGVPGATCDPLFEAAAAAHLELVVTASDLDAGYAADGCARMTGLSLLSVTYGVGTMSLLAVVAGAYAERSPIVVVNGGPSDLDLRLQGEHDTYFSHSNGKPSTDLAVFREVTGFAARVKSADDVVRVVDAALACALQEKRPAYIEIPKHLWDAPAPAPPTSLVSARPSPSGREAEVAAAVVARLASAKRPLLLLGAEVLRHGLSSKAAALIERLGVPYATTLLGKSAVAESTSGFAGVYLGARSAPALRSAVDEADVVVALGCILGRSYRELASEKSARLFAIGHRRAKLGRAAPLTVSLLDVVDALLAALPSQPSDRARTALPRATRKEPRTAAHAAAAPAAGVGYDDVIAAVDGVLDENTIVITDTSLSMYPAADLDVRGVGSFICNGVWQSIGFSVGVAAGVALAAPEKRLVVVCGDGGFQMTAQSLSTLARRNVKATVLVLDNGRYGIEQFLLEPSYFSSSSRGIAYLDLHAWDYVAFASALGVRHASRATTTAELQRALEAARHVEGPAVIHVRVPPRDLPAQLRV